MLLLTLACALAQADPAEEMLEELTGPAPSRRAEPTPDVSGADRPRRPRRGDTWDTWGLLRLQWEAAGEASTGRHRLLRGRLIAGVDVRPTLATHAVLELEAMSGALVGDLPHEDLAVARAEQSWRRVLPRRAALVFDHPELGTVTFGLDTTRWGLGMVHNDGTAVPFVGETRTGDISGRLAFDLMPTAVPGLHLDLAGDVVVRDDRADLRRGDTAVRGWLGARYEQRALAAGLLGTVRWQRDASGLTSTRWPLSACLSARTGPEHARVSLGLQTEGALVLGSTGRVEGPRRVASGGGLARVRLDLQDLSATLFAEGGLASWDPDPYDDVERSFAMHTDLSIGLLMIPEALPITTTGGFADEDDGEPSPTALGSLQGAAYVAGGVRLRPSPGLDLRAGLLSAWRPEALDRSQALGTEAHGAVNAWLALPGALTLRLGVDAALWWPSWLLGPVPLQGLVRGRAALHW